MANKMKKYYGEKNWYETPYFWVMDEDDIEWRKMNGEIPNGKMLKPGDTEFFLLSPPFHDSDKNSNIFFDAWNYGFEDTNIFITDTEEYNWYKKRRI
jgi:hypothetical protein